MKKPKFDTPCANTRCPSLVQGRCQHPATARSCSGYRVPKPPPSRVVMCRPQFEEPIVAETKHHTIRPIPKRPIRPNTLLRFRVWTGTAYRSPQREFHTAALLSVMPAFIYRDCVKLIDDQAQKVVTIRGADLERFARADGFPDWATMLAWFEAEHCLPFEGVLIRWKETV